METIRRWEMFELALQAEAPGNPFTDVTFEVEFAHRNRTLFVRGFYDGEETFRARCMPDAEGEWRYLTRSSLPALDGLRGTFTCAPAAPGVRGTVRVADEAHFAYADGTPYHPVGTTCYVWNHQGEALEERTLATLRTAPFNKLRMCVFPKRYLYNLNEPPDYPFAGEYPHTWDRSMMDPRKSPQPPNCWDFTRFNPAYFRRLERRVADLNALGIEADLIVFHPYDHGAWGFDQLPPEVNDRYLAYLVARLAAYRNVWWSLANEYDLMRSRNLADWDHYFQYIQELDPWQHPRSVHNCFGFYDHAKPWVTHCSVQSGDLERVPEWLKQYRKPVVIDECGYEGDIPLPWGSLSAEALVECFWQGFAAGGYVGHGETYLNPEERLWWSKGGELEGESPARIAFLRKIIEAVPGAGLLPVQNNPQAQRVMRYGVYKFMAAGYAGTDYYLLYLGRHNPRIRLFTLPEGRTYRIDLLDTWNMTIERLAEHASGEVSVELPRRKWLALRLEAER